MKSNKPFKNTALKQKDKIHKAVINKKFKKNVFLSEQKKEQKKINKLREAKLLVIDYIRFYFQLASIEFSLEKTRQIQTMNQEEASNYTQLEQAIIEGIEETRGIIEATKLELEDAKIIRKNKLEYDEIGKKINELASREASDARIKEIEAEKETLREKERQIELKLAQRREQFSVIIKSIHQLQELIFEEDGVGYLSDEAADEDLNEPEVIPLDISQE